MVFIPENRVKYHAMKKLAPPVLILALVLAVGPVIPVLAEDAPFDASHVAWSRLELKASKFFFTAKSTVQLRPMDASEAASEWIHSTQGKLVGPTGPEVMEITIESSGFGASTNRVWFNPGQADALQRSKLKPKSYRKAARFLENGVFVLRTSPIDNSEAGKPPAEWTKLQQYTYPKSKGGGCEVVSEPSVLLYMVSARKSEQPLRICVFSNKQIIPISIEAAGTEKVDVDYQEIRSGAAPKRRTGKIEALRLAVRPVSGDGEIELMGLKGDVEILLDRASRIPLELRGDTDVGSVKVKLTSVELR